MSISLWMSDWAPEATAESTWQSRPLWGRALQALLFVGPLFLGFLVSLAISTGLPEPTSRIEQFTSLGILLLCTTVVIASAERLARLVAPVTVLLRMTMVFPDEAPNRVRLASRCSSIDELRRTMLEVDEFGLGTSANEAAETLLVLVAAAGRHDRMTRGHSERVRAFTEVIAQEMGLSEEDRSKLRWAALLHDVGKMQIPYEILNKPGRLSDTEYEIVKQHPMIGDALVEPLRDFLGPWADTVAQHHERWDGEGYPAKLGGTDICLGARIVAVADTFDVITSLRSYKDTSPAHVARAEIARCAGTQFDPEVVRAFLQVGMAPFRWRLVPLSIAAQIPRLATILSPVAGGVTSAAVSAAPVMAVSAATLGAVAATQTSALPLEEPPAVLSGTGQDADPAIKDSPGGYSRGGDSPIEGNPRFATTADRDRIVTVTTLDLTVTTTVPVPPTTAPNPPAAPPTTAGPPTTSGPWSRTPALPPSTPIPSTPTPSDPPPSTSISSTPIPSTPNPSDPPPTPSPASDPEPMLVSDPEPSPPSDTPAGPVTPAPPAFDLGSVSGLAPLSFS